MLIIFTSTRQSTEETIDDEDRPLIVAYRRRLKHNGKFEPKCDDDEYPIHIQDIVELPDYYYKLHAEKTSTNVVRKFGHSTSLHADC